MYIPIYTNECNHYDKIIEREQMLRKHFIDKNRFCSNMNKMKFINEYDDIISTYLNNMMWMTLAQPVNLIDSL